MAARHRDTPAVGRAVPPGVDRHRARRAAAGQLPRPGRGAPGRPPPAGRVAAGPGPRPAVRAGGPGAARHARPGGGVRRALRRRPGGVLAGQRRRRPLRDGRRQPGPLGELVQLPGGREGGGGPPRRRGAPAPGDALRPPGPDAGRPPAARPGPADRLRARLRRLPRLRAEGRLRRRRGAPAGRAGRAAALLRPRAGAGPPGPPGLAARAGHRRAPGRPAGWPRRPRCWPRCRRCRSRCRRTRRPPRRCWPGTAGTTTPR